MLKIKENINLVRDEIKQNSHKAEKDIRLLQLAKVKVILRLKVHMTQDKKSSVKTTYRKHWRKRNCLKSLEIEWHFIGPIQSNKCKLISENFSWVQTVDRIKIVNKLNQYRHSKKPLNICIQVNISEENTKSGIGLR